MVTREPSHPRERAYSRAVVSWVAFVGVAGGTGCTAPRVNLPRPVEGPLGTSDYQHVRIKLEAFTVSNRTSRDRDEHVRLLRDSFLEYVAAGARYGEVVFDPRVPEYQDDLVDIRLTTLIDLDHEHYRTIVFDALFFYPFSGFWPLTPAWGESTVDVVVQSKLPDGQVQVAKAEVVADYSLIFYSWYRTEPIRESFRRAYGAAFESISKQVADKVPQLVEQIPREGVTASATTSVAFASPTLEDVIRQPEGEAPSIDYDIALQLAYAQLDGQQQKIRLTEEGFRLIHRPVKKADWGWFSRYFSALGGVEGGYQRGLARVKSKARTSSGQIETVGSGDATSEAFKVAFYAPPDRTGFFFPPTLGFLSQTITIEGFIEDVPVFDVAGSDTIPAVVTDPSTGILVDPDDPIAYELKLKSAFVGQQVGINLVAGTDHVQMFWSMRAGLNLVEWRHVDVMLDDSREKGSNFEFFKSGVLATQAGLVFPDIHLALRTAAQFEWYLAFDYPEPVDFLAQSKFNPEKMIFERQRVFVDGASLIDFNWQVSAVVLF